MGSKKSSDEIHEKHARQKAARDKERAAAGYKPHKGISLGPSQKKENPLSNPLTQKFISQLRLHRAKGINKHVKEEYKPRKV